MSFNADLCETEDICRPAAIQPHGALLCARTADMALVAMSANAEQILGRSRSDLPLGGFLPGEALERLSAYARSVPTDESGLEFDFADGNIGTHGGNVFAHAKGETIFVEIEPLERDDLPRSGDIDALGAEIRNLGQATTPDQLCAMAVRAVQRITGMERVLAYRFGAEGHGEVVAEIIAEDWHDSFAGYHFPAADIPGQARTLYLSQPGRFTPHRDYELAQLLAVADGVDVKVLDLGHCRLRSLSPAHRTYQENLGVDGAMSLSIISQDRLWGLIVGHHRQPHRIPIPKRHISVALASALGLRLAALEATAENEARIRHLRIHTRMLEQIAASDDFVASLTCGHIRLTDLFENAVGGAVVHDFEGEGDIRMVGTAPPLATIRHLSQVVRAKSRNGVFATDCLNELFPEAPPALSGISGLLAITVDDDDRDVIMWFQPEAVSTTIWAGATPEAVEREKSQGNFIPRQSFARWATVQKGRSMPWPIWAITIASSLRGTINNVILRQRSIIRTLDLKAKDYARSNKDLEQFAYVISHDLREPLRMINSFIRLLERQIGSTLNNEQKEFVSYAVDASSRMDRMIIDLLEYSQIGAKNVAFDAVELASVFSHAISNLRGKIATTGAEVTIASDLPPIVGNAIELERLFQNLIGNALKFCDPDKTPRVDIRSRVSDGEAVITLVDNGIGIDPKDFDRIFKIFQRLDTARHAEGTGIGLPACRKIVEHHNGRIWVESEPGHGSSFHVAIPLALPSSPFAAKPETAGRHAPKPGPRRPDLRPGRQEVLAPKTVAHQGNMRVLLVEDSPGDARLITMMLRESRAHQFTISHVTTLADALDVIVGGAVIDVALVDLNLPDSRGLLTVSHIQDADPHLPIVIMTGLDDPATAVDALEAGAQDYLIKGEDDDRSIARAIQHAMTRKHAQIEHKHLADRLTGEYERLSEELSVARSMQFDLLPRGNAVPEIDGLRIDSFFEPSSALGGDLWGWIPCGEDKVAFYAFDFSGHGVGAALNTFRLHALINQFAGDCSDPATVLGHLNKGLVSLLPRGQYATMLLLMVDMAGEQLLWSAAGSPPPVLTYPSQKPIPLDTQGKPLGLSANSSYRNRIIRFPPGSSLFIYSDALTEARDDNGALVGEAGMLRLIQAFRSPDGGVDVSALAESLFAMAGKPLEDDLTLVCLCRAQSKGQETIAPFQLPMIVVDGDWGGSMAEEAASIGCLSVRECDVPSNMDNPRILASRDISAFARGIAEPFNGFLEITGTGISDVHRRCAKAVGMGGLAISLRTASAWDNGLVEALTTAIATRFAVGDDRERDRLSICLAEAVANAIIHGNLGISGGLSSEVVAWERYSDLIEMRRSDPAFNSRRLEITAVPLEGGAIELTVSDQGKGFEIATLSKKPPDSATSGRGLVLIGKLTRRYTTEDQGRALVMEIACGAKLPAI